MDLKYINKLTARFGYRIIPDTISLPPDLTGDRSFMEMYNQVRPFTMTSPERLYALYQTVHYIIGNRIPGDFVECGVWKGGSCMMMALVLLKLGVSDRRIFLYDTFEGMSEPTELDKQFSGEKAGQLLDQADKSNASSVWCYSSLDEVKMNVLSAGYPAGMLNFVKGKVEDTIPGEIPGSIALLRLDTDWFESTLHELNHLYPLLCENGVLIIDDFGHWEGAKKAVLQYFEEKSLKPLFNRIDYTGRIIVKSGNLMI
jgi:hypothetical protein